MDYVMLYFHIVIILLIVHFILTIFSCNKYYFILDAIIISILGTLFLFINTNHYDIYKILILYICTRSFIVLTLFIKNLINKEIIKINKCNLYHNIFLVINIIINLFFIISYIYLFLSAYA